MKKVCSVLFALSALIALRVEAQVKEFLKLIATIAMPGPKDGDFDHFAPDLDAHRLILTAEENDKVLVLDVTTN